MEQSDQRPWTIKDVCREAECSPGKLADADRGGGLKKKKSGRTVFYDPQEVRVWIDNGRPNEPIAEIPSATTLPPPGRCLPIDQASTFLSLGEDEIWEYVRTGALRAFGDQFHITDLREFVRANNGRFRYPIFRYTDGVKEFRGYADESQEIWEIDLGLPEWDDSTVDIDRNQPSVTWPS